MNEIYLKNHFHLFFFLAIASGFFTSIQQDSGSSNKSNLIPSSISQNFDVCEQPVNLQVAYEIGMPTSQISWDGILPQEGWIILYANDNMIDINVYLSDPENYFNPEVNIERVYSNQRHLYMNMLHPGIYEAYVVADCGDGNLLASEKVNFEMAERGPEIISEECAAPTNFNYVQNEDFSYDISWNPQDGELYQIAWGPLGMEMNENYFDDPQTGSMILNENPYHLVFTGPEAEQSRSIFIRKFCGENIFSEWALTDCAEPSGLDSEVTETHVNLSWTPSDQDFGWQVAYGPQGFNPDDPEAPNVNFENVYNNPSLSLLLTNLEQGIQYDFYVRTNCLAENYSIWIGPGSFTTDFLPCIPIEDLFVDHVTYQTADISWTPQSNELEWEVTYGLSPFDPEQAMTIVVNDPEIILTNLASSSTYELFITSNCASGETTQSETITFTTTESDDTYCIPYFLNGCTYDFIDHLILDGENDTRLYNLNTGCTDSNYNNQTDEVVDLAPGNQYFVRVSHGNFNIVGDHLAIWIDFNDDGTFDNITERVGDGELESGGFTNVNITIPESSEVGQHRMRVMLAFNAYSYQLTPCNEGDTYSTNGEVHDYTANVLFLENCTNAEAGTIMDDFEICPDEDFSVTTTGVSDPAFGLERKWQYSPAGQNNWVDLEGGLLPTATVYGGIQEATDFRYVVSCDLSGESSISNVLHVTISTFCYCKPEADCGGPGGLQINNLKIVGETVTLDNDTGCTGYGDYTIEFPPDLLQGETYSISISAFNASLGSDKIKAWIDYNNNTIFDSEEVIMDYPGGLPDYTITNEFMIPSDVSPGIYRLRARIGWWGSPTITGCSPLGFGETEDYLIEVISNEECSVPTNISITQDGDPTSATVSWLPGGSETQWELIYVPAGNNPENEDPILVENSPSLVITELEPNTDYDVYVRAICDASTSEWVGPVSFTTIILSVEDVSFKDFAYFPVPTDNTINLKAVNVIDKVEILNMSGQIVLRFQPMAKHSELDLSKLSSGVYFMRVLIHEKSRIFKIIKR